MPKTDCNNLIALSEMYRLMVYMLHGKTLLEKYTRLNIHHPWTQAQWSYCLRVRNSWYISLYINIYRRTLNLRRRRKKATNCLSIQSYYHSLSPTFSLLKHLTLMSRWPRSVSADRDLNPSPHKQTWRWVILLYFEHCILTSFLIHQGY